MVSYGTEGLGLVAAGVLAERAGLFPVMAVGAAGMLLAVPCLLVSHVRRLRTIPLAEA